MQVRKLKSGDVIMSCALTSLRFTPPRSVGAPVSVTISATPYSIEESDEVIGCYGCLGLLSLQSTPVLLLVTGLAVRAEGDVQVVTDVNFVSLAPPVVDTSESLRKAWRSLRKVLRDGSFHFSRSEDLSMRLASQMQRGEEARRFSCEPQARTDLQRIPVPELGGRFIWNSFLLRPLADLLASLPRHLQAPLAASGLFLPVARGYFGSTLVRHADTAVKVALYSRRDYHREGTRFLKRGIDEDGNVANFAETEMRLTCSSDGGGQKRVFSFVQVRGSVPAFWTETASLNGRPAVEISDDIVAKSLPAFSLHVRHLERSYDGPVHALTFLHERHSGVLSAEAPLLRAYKALVTQSRLGSTADTLTLDSLDITASNLNTLPRRINAMVQPYIEQVLFTEVSCDVSDGSSRLESEQRGVFRINCRDCLDRTNLAEFCCSDLVLGAMLRKAGLPAAIPGSDLDRAHRALWAANGDALAEIYAGSPSMTSELIRSGKSTVKQEIENKADALRRYRQEVEHDDEKNCATEILTGEHRSHACPCCIRSRTPVEDSRPVRLVVLTPARLI